jgi:hypothetical protein
MSIQEQIDHHLSFIQESPYGRLSLPTFRYKKIAELLKIDYDSLDKAKKNIFKSYCFERRIFAESDFTRFGILKTLK